MVPKSKSLFCLGRCWEMFEFRIFGRPTLMLPLHYIYFRLYVDGCSIREEMDISIIGISGNIKTVSITSMNRWYSVPRAYVI